MLAPGIPAVSSLRARDTPADPNEGDAVPDNDVLPDYVPETPWKALIVQQEGDGPTVVHLWAVDDGGRPTHYEAVATLGLSDELVSVQAWSKDAEGRRARMTIREPLERSVAEALLRERIPDVEFPGEDEWYFG